VRFLNLRFLLVTGVVLLLIFGGLFGWVWYQGRPDKLYESAQQYYHQGEQLRKSGDPDWDKKVSAEDQAKARDAYQRAQTQIDAFIQKAPHDPRLPQAYVLRFKALKPLSRLVEMDEESRKVPEAERKAAGLYEDAFRSGEAAWKLDNNNLEAQAIRLADFFRRSDFRNAYPFAQALVDNPQLPKDAKAVDMEDFADAVVGATTWWRCGTWSGTNPTGRWRR
jgi:hypothetical protein